MKSTKSILASIAAAGLLMSQPAVAAAQSVSDVRTGSVSGDAEDLAAANGPGVALFAVLAVAVAAFWPVVFEDDDNDAVAPVSP